MITTKAIEVGAKVKLRKVTKVYASYKLAFKKLGFVNLTQNPENLRDIPKLKDTFFTVFAVSEHEKFESLVGIENSDGIQILTTRDSIYEVKPTVSTFYSTTL